MMEATTEIGHTTEPMSITGQPALGIGNDGSDWMVHAGGGRPVATFHTNRGAQGSKTRTSEEARANAALWCAAPDLLAACVALSRRMDAWARSGNPPQSNDKAAMQMGRAAIAKATR
jgi:hypothetical protein